jgi:hypothetical protein
MIANTDQTVKAEQPKPRRYGRHPLNIVKRMVQAKLSKNQMVVYMTLGEYLIKNSNTTVNLDDDRLAEATGLDLRQVADARRAFSASDGDTEFVRVRPATTKYNRRIVGTYTYRLLEAQELENEILEPDFSVPNVDQKVEKSVTESQEPGNEMSGNREQKVKKSVNQSGANPGPTRESRQASKSYTNYITNYTTNYAQGGELLVEKIVSQWGEIRGSAAKPEQVEQLIQYCQASNPNLQDQELLEMLATAFKHPDHLIGKTPLWFKTNKGRGLIDELLAKKTGQATQQRQRDKTQQTLAQMTKPSPSPTDDDSQDLLEKGRQFVLRWTEFGDLTPAQRMERFFRRLPSTLFLDCGLRASGQDRARLNKILRQGLTESDFPTLQATESHGNITIDQSEQGTQRIGGLMAELLGGRRE